jgi:hypothetical protein
MGREEKRRGRRERRKGKSKRRVPGTWLRLCGRDDLRFRSTKGFSSLVPNLLLPWRILLRLLRSMEEELRCARSGVSFRSERRTAATETGQGRRLTSKGLATCFPLCVLGVACGRFLTG